jgi:DNA-binding beta-propeller fold protein YncE
MRIATAVLALLAPVLAAAQNAPPPLPYSPAPDTFQLPEGANFGGVSATAINSAGHIFVFNRGAHPIVEFDRDGKFVRYLADGLIQRAHGIRIDREDNIWITDVRLHAVFKLSPQGRILLVLGTPGAAGDFNARFKMAMLSEPTDVAFGPVGEIYVTEGHGGEINRIRKFDRDGNFIKSWGGKKGSGPGEFSTPHNIATGPDGLLYVTDRENHRIQVFDPDGNLKKTWPFAGSPNGLAIGPDGALYATEADGGRVWKLGWDGQILGEIGGLGKAPGQFGEAHTIVIDASRNIFVSDTLNWRVQKFTPKK